MFEWQVILEEYRKLAAVHMIAVIEVFLQMQNSSWRFTIRTQSLI